MPHDEDEESWFLEKIEALITIFLDYDWAAIIKRLHLTKICQKHQIFQGIFQMVGSFCLRVDALLRWRCVVCEMIDFLVLDESITLHLCPLFRVNEVEEYNLGFLSYSLVDTDCFISFEFFELKGQFPKLVMCKKV